MLSIRKSVKGKLGMGFGLILALVCVLGVFSLATIQRTSAVTDQIYNQNMAAWQKVSRVSDLASAIRGDILAALMFRSQDTGDLVSNLQSAVADIKTNWSAYYPELMVSKEESQTAKKVASHLEVFYPKLEKFIKKVGKRRFMGAVNYYFENMGSDLRGLVEDLDYLVELQAVSAQQAYHDGVQVANSRMWVIAGVMIAVLITTFVITILLVRMITRPLGHARSLVESIADGHLDNNVDNTFQDEFGVMLDGLGDMQNRLAAIVSDVRGHSESVSAGASQIASGNDELSTRTQQQASNLQETAASMEEMTSTVKQNADNAEQADQLARGVRSQADEGGEVIGRAVTAMGEISQASHKITDIISLIDDIAFQTNLLALNASVEAARAGEQGRGFAVVAEEVRNLAGRCASAAKDIKELVNDTTTKVEDGSKQVSLSGETLGEIVESINKVSDIISEIASASNEQSSGIDQVNQAVSQMDSVTQQNASLVEESAAASRSLAEKADTLKREMAYFKLADNRSGISQGLGDVSESGSSIASGILPAPNSNDSKRHVPAPDTDGYAKGERSKTQSESYDGADADDWATF